MDDVRVRAYAGGSEGIEKRRLRIGFVPLADCAPLVFAKERGYFRRHGLDVELSREVSWATLRDRVAAGALDAAQMLAPMTFASALGLGGVALPICTGMSLDLDGNAITVSDALHRRLADADPDALAARPVRATALRALIEADRDAGLPPMRFGVVFPHSMHDLELRYWLASAGIDPDRDVSLRVVPPPLMVARLEEGQLDGYCVGEPWNALAEHRGSGRMLVTKHEIWNHSPEKVLGVTEEWLQAHPATHRALLGALLEAAAFVDAPESRLEVAHVIAGESYVDVPVDVLARSLGGEAAPVFHRNAATHPWISHAAWVLSQMLRWGTIEKPIDVRALARRVYRPDLHREAAADVGLPAPLADVKIEAAHFDGVRFDPDRILAYLEGFAVSALRVRLDELAELNS